MVERISVEELNQYSNLKSSILENIEEISEEANLNNKEDYESLIRFCGWIINDSNKILDIINKDKESVASLEEKK